MGNADKKSVIEQIQEDEPYGVLNEDSIKNSIITLLGKPFKLIGTDDPLWMDFKTKTKLDLYLREVELNKSIEEFKNNLPKFKK